MICAINRALVANVSRLRPTCVSLVSHFHAVKTVKKQHRVPVSHLNADTLARIRARAGKHQTSGTSGTPRTPTTKGQAMSVETILSKLPDDIITKMRNWARSHAGGSVYARSKIFDDVRVSSGFDETIVPILRGEAEDIDNALAVLPGQLRQAVSLFWQYEQPPLAWLGRRMNPHGKPLDWRTVQARIERGHEYLICAIRQQKARLRRYQAEAAEQFAAY